MREDNILFSMEKMEKREHVFRGLCESRTLDEYRGRLCNPVADEQRAKIVTEILESRKQEIAHCKELRAVFDERTDRGDFENAQDSEKDKAARKEREELLKEIEEAQAYALSEVREACDSRSLIQESEFEEFGFRLVTYSRPTRYLEGVNVDGYLPWLDKDPKKYPSTVDQLISFVVYKKAFVAAKAGLGAAMRGQMIPSSDNPLRIESIYVMPPEENFYSAAIAEQEGLGWARVHEFTPPVLMRSALYNSDIYNALCVGLAQAARYGVLHEVLPGGLDRWAQRPEFHEASYPTAAYIDLMMAQAFAYFSERNIALTVAALESYFSGRSASQLQHPGLVEDHLRVHLGLEEGATLAVDVAMWNEGQLLTRGTPNPFAALVRIWESGLAPAFLSEGHVGIVYTPLNEYIKPRDISEDKVNIARFVRAARPRPVARGRQEVGDADIEAMIQRLYNPRDPQQ